MADVIYITHRSTAFSSLQTLTLGLINWTLRAGEFLGGPFAAPNPGTKSGGVRACAQTGIGITLTRRPIS